MQNRREISSFRALLGFALMGLCSAAFAAGLHSARVTVVDDSEAVRVAGFRAALAQVVVKLSGQRRVLDSPQVGELLDGAADLVEEYRYRPQPRPAVAATVPPTASSELVPLPGAVPESPSVASAPPTPTPPAMLELSVRFMAPTLDAELRRLGLPRWPSDRPPVLLWIAAADPQRAELARLARAVLEARGVPVLEPLWDLQDTMTLGDASQFDPAKLATASSRYEARHWLALAPVTGVDGVKGPWQLGGTAPVADALDAKDLSGWIDSAVNAAIDHLAATEAYLPGGQTREVALIFEDVPDYGAYRAAVGALETLEMVRAVQITAMNAGRVAVVVQLDGDPALLWRALAENPRFEPVVAEAASGTAAQDATPRTAEGGDSPRTEDGDSPRTEGGDSPRTESGDSPRTESGDTPAMEGGDAPGTEGSGSPGTEGSDSPGAEGTASADAGGSDATAAGDGGSAGTTEHRYRWREP